MSLIYFDITEIEPIFGLNDAPVGEPSVVPFGPRHDVMTMIPFPPTMFPDTISIKRAKYDQIGGRNVLSHLSPEPEEIASVQSKRIQRIEPDSGNLTTATIHNVRTPINRNLIPNDNIVWMDRSGHVHTLVVVGHSEPRGIGDIVYVTECTEIV